MFPNSSDVTKFALFALVLSAAFVLYLYSWENNVWRENTGEINLRNASIRNPDVTLVKDNHIRNPGVTLVKDNHIRNPGVTLVKDNHIRNPGVTLVKDSHIFQVIIITQRRHWSLKRLLKSLENAEYHNESVNLIIRIDFDQSKDHAKTVEVANDFVFTHGTKRVAVSNKKQGLIYAWFRSWIPASDTERAVILEDDMELSPLWYVWIQKAWLEFGNITELAGISLSRQRLNASNGESIIVSNDLPFLYRMFSTYGFSPNARYWRGFIEWARRIDLKKTDVRVKGTITSSWWSAGSNMWSQHFIWWCSSGPQLYTLYVHSKNGALVTHWQEKGEHSDRKVGAPSEKLLTKMEPLLQTFPKVLQHYGWNFKPERYKTTDNL